VGKSFVKTVRENLAEVEQKQFETLLELTSKHIGYLVVVS